MSEQQNNFDGGKLGAAFDAGLARKPLPDKTAAGEFIYFISDNDVAKVKEYVEKYGENIIERSPFYAWSPLTLACAGGPRGQECTEIVQLLLDNGAKVENRTGFGNGDENTPLMIAARNFQPETVELLLARGADVTATDKYGHNARQIAAQRLYRDYDAPAGQNDWPEEKCIRLLDTALAARTAAKTAQPTAAKNSI